MSKRIESEPLGYVRHWIPRVIYTQGVKRIADECGAHWLLDAIASYSAQLREQGEPFQVWALQANDGDWPIESVTLVCEDGDRGDGPKTLVTQYIEYSDFPRDLLPCLLWAEEGAEGLCIMLPEER